ncbi:MAG TPA: glycosyltransferase N-terminal domain-containing protein, partial [Flavisolibacter sp.]|nr:glycosyltransferase N-terminal domain-containing protein [Flavisolibacter sp.]
MIFFYNLFIALFQVSIRIAALWNMKAAQWIYGRKNLFPELKETVSSTNNIWVHCASVGELEQGKPVIEDLKKRYPHFKILVTFFSPSGYQQGKKYKGADYVFFLPLDTNKNALQFISLVQPKLVVFVKYDFWYHHLKAVHDRRIPLLLISSIFRKNQLFFKWYGSFYRDILKLFTCLFVQDKASLGLLHSIKINNCVVSGDTRFDRVSAIVANRKTVEGIAGFIKDSNVIVAGSTWPNDEALLAQLLPELPPDYKLIIAPHEINPAHLHQL